MLSRAQNVLLIKCKESIGFVYAHINMVPNGQLSVKDKAQVYFFGATINWCTASLGALVFR